MRTQILKGAGLAVVLGMLTLSAPAPVAAADIRANVPFSFTVAKKVLPPGVYNVTSGVAHSLIVRGFGSGAIVLGQRTESATTTSPKLVFHRYGDEYILREVWMGSGSGYQLPQTARERELASGRSGAATASASFERVEVAIQ
ncbi:MAG TPA: hypothetical protein VEQ84_03645 [Vicinamibacteria bacterium]|nr:hypothetical protein [Vicinamibacteria bacterium]